MKGCETATVGMENENLVASGRPTIWGLWPEPSRTKEQWGIS